MYYPFNTTFTLTIMMILALIAVFFDLLIMQCILIILYSVIAVSMVVIHLEDVETGRDIPWFD